MTVPVAEEASYTQTDLDHLRLLSLFHYVMAGMMALFGLFPVLHLLFGVGMLFFPDLLDGADGPPPMLFGILFTAVPLFIIVVMEVMAALVAFAGLSIARHRRHVFCIIVAGVLCTLMPPMGVVLGGFTLVVLLRPGVRRLFEETASLYA